MDDTGRHPLVEQIEAIDSAIAELTRNRDKISAEIEEHAVERRRLLRLLYAPPPPAYHRLT